MIVEDSPVKVKALVEGKHFLKVSLVSAT
jgi:hypothetical protein